MKNTNSLNKLEYENKTRQEIINVELLKIHYPAGSRIECIKMDDPYHPVPSGTIGTVDYIDDIGTIHMKWDNGQSLGLIPNKDYFKLISN